MRLIQIPDSFAQKIYVVSRETLHQEIYKKRLIEDELDEKLKKNVLLIVKLLIEKIIGFRINGHPKLTLETFDTSIDYRHLTRYYIKFFDETLRGRESFHTI